MKYKLTAKRSINVSQDSNNVVIPAGTELTAYDNNAYYDGATFDWTEYTGVFVAEGLDSGCGLDIQDLQAEPGKSYKPKSKQYFRNVDVAPGGGGSDAALADAELMFSQYEQDKKLTSMDVAGCQQETIDALVNMFKSNGFADAAYDAETDTIEIQPEYDFDVTYHVTAALISITAAFGGVPIAIVNPDGGVHEIPAGQGYSVFGEGTVAKLYKDGTFVKEVDLYQPFDGSESTGGAITMLPDITEPGDYRVTIEHGKWMPNTLGDIYEAPELAGKSSLESLLAAYTIDEASMSIDTGSYVTVHAFRPVGHSVLNNALYGCPIHGAINWLLPDCLRADQAVYGTSISLIDSISMPNITTASKMFMHSTVASINNLAFGQIDDVSNMFADCQNLRSIGHISGITQVTDAVYMFYRCYALQHVMFDDLPVSSDCTIDLSDCRVLSGDTLQWLIDNPNLNEGEATITFPAGIDSKWYNFDDCKSRLESLGYTVEVASA